jgi:hypothetical protein
MHEALFFTHVVHQQCTRRTSIVAPRNAFEAFLPSRVPALNLDLGIFNVNNFRSELDTNCDIVIDTEPFVGELEQDT